ncbi:MAG: rhomboid family intramembrane serine protease [Chloroflexi bacterium]|nr:rhomboid family intramembrane serine protease [Chloroflexota bacterium]
MINAHIQVIKNGLMRHAKILGAIVVLLWVIELVDTLSGHQLDLYGVQPRSLIGLRNILFAPFLHRSFWHLLANTIPFLLLGWFVMLRSVYEFFYVSVIAALVSGLGAWLFGAAHTIHLGISGVIFGYMGFLLLRSYFEQSAQALVLAVVAFFLFGGTLWGVLPLQPDISWLGHLFGFIGGGLAAYRLTGGQRSWPRINRRYKYIDAR